MEAPNKAEAGSGGGGSNGRGGGDGMSVSVEFQAESMPMEWTDEKHSMYLKSMEASFIDQLYDSMNMLREHIKNDSLPGVVSSKSRINTDPSSFQFKVQQDSCWKKLSFNRPEPQQSKADDSCGFMTSPWIQHFRSVPKVPGSECGNDHRISGGYTGQPNGNDGNSSASMANSDRIPHCNSQLRHQVVGSNTEVSDQNFAYEDREDENRRATCRAQRTSDQGLVYPSPSNGLQRLTINSNDRTST